MISQLKRKQKIIPLTIGDIPQMIKIGEQSNLSVWTFEDYTDELGRSDSIGLAYKNHVDKNDGREMVSGFIIVRLITANNTHNNSNTFNDVQTGAECEILNIAVHSSLRRNGIGQLLFDAAVEKCRAENVESVWLEVRKNNQAAVKFYERNAFEVVYTRKNYYQNPSDDALVMRAELTNARTKFTSTT